MSAHTDQCALTLSLVFGTKTSSASMTALITIRINLIIQSASVLVFDKFDGQQRVNIYIYIIDIYLDVVMTTSK